MGVELHVVDLRVVRDLADRGGVLQVVYGDRLEVQKVGDHLGAFLANARRQQIGLH